MKYLLAILLVSCMFTFGCDNSGVYIPPTTPTQNSDDNGGGDTGGGNTNGGNTDGSANQGGGAGDSQNNSSPNSGKKAPRVYMTPEVK
jgi:hypothetical protein